LGVSVELDGVDDDMYIPYGGGIQGL
jgi:hypothetical protein